MLISPKISHGNIKNWESYLKNTKVEVFFYTPFIYRARSKDKEIDQEYSTQDTRHDVVHQDHS